MALFVIIRIKVFLAFSTLFHYPELANPFRVLHFPEEMGEILCKPRGKPCTIYENIVVVTPPHLPSCTSGGGSGGGLTNGGR